MRQFFFTTDDRVEDTVTLSPKESQHICRVLRLQPGDNVELLDGSGTIFGAEIITLGKRVQARIVSGRRIAKRQKGELWLGQGIVKTKKMELLLQKCTELGVGSFTPFASSRCQGNIIAQSRKKNDRWQRIIDESCKQCGRPQPMILHENKTFEEVTSSKSKEHKVIKLLFWEREELTGLVDLSSDLTSQENVRLLFGPEGGFTEDEIAMARLAGWRTVGLGRSILRAETAAIAAVAVVQHLLGNM